jgi:hypothetical protein
MQNEMDFVVLDGVMVLVVSLCLTILPSGILLPRIGNSLAIRPWRCE